MILKALAIISTLITIGNAGWVFAAEVGLILKAVAIFSSLHAVWDTSYGYTFGLWGADVSYAVFVGYKLMSLHA